MIVGNVLTLALTPGTVNYRAVYGTITQTNLVTPTAKGTVSSSAMDRKLGGGGVIPYTWEEQQAQWDGVVAEWQAKTLADYAELNGQRAYISYSTYYNSTDGRYYLHSDLYSGFSIWNTSAIAGAKVFQIRAELDLEQMDSLIYFATYTDAQPTTTMTDMQSQGVTYVSGWNWYDLDEPMIIGDRLLVGCFPKLLTITDPGTESWSKTFYAGILNPLNYQTKHYTEPA